MADSRRPHLLAGLTLALLLSLLVLLPSAEAIAAAHLATGAGEHILDRDTARIDYQGARFEHLSTGDGLSYFSITAIHQDPRGFMWFGTQGGLNKYDGYRFTVFRHDPSNRASLAGDLVTAICSDREGYLWVGTSAGLDRLERASGTFVHFLASSPVTAVLQDAKGALWVGTRSGLWALEPGAADLVRQLPYDPQRPDAPDRLASDVINTLLEDDQGALWIGTPTGLTRLDPDRRTLTHYGSDATEPNSLADPQVITLFQDGTGRLWIGTAGGGLYRLLPTSGVFVRYANRAGDPGSLSNAPVTSIVEDSTGALWVGTYDGLNLLLPGGSRFVHLRHDPDDTASLADNLVTSLYWDRSGVLWIGTILSGASRYDARAAWFETYRRRDGLAGGLSDRVVLAAEEDGQGDVWIGTLLGGVNRLDLETGAVTTYTYDPEDSNSLRGSEVDAVHIDSGGTVWAGTSSGWLERYDPESDRFLPVSNLLHGITSILETHDKHLVVGTQRGAVRLDPESGFRSSLSLRLADKSIAGIYEDPDEMLWVGTECSGIEVLAPVDEMNRKPGESSYRSIDHYEHDPLDPASLGHDCVFSIWEDPTDPGAIWVATWGGGLDRLDRTTATFAHYTERDGLPSDMIGCVVGDDRGYLWVGGAGGLVRFDPQTETFRVFDQAEGVPPSAMVSCSEGPSGHFFFGGVDGLVVFDPAVIQDRSQPPPIVISSIRLFGDVIRADVSPEEEVELMHDSNSISFEFAALDYMDPAKNQYAYRMENLDQDWVYAGTRHYADYRDLKPGRYVFRVRGSNSDGVWNMQGTAVHVRVRPPFWATWWFRGSAGLLVVAALAAGVRLRLGATEAHNRELALQVAERTHEIEQRRRVAAGLRDILAVLNSDRPLAEVLDYTVAQARGLMGAEAAVLHRLEAGASSVAIETSSGLPADLAGLEAVPFRATGADEAILHRKPSAIPDLVILAPAEGANEAGGKWLSVTRELYGSLLAIPVVVGGAADRCLVLYFSRPQTFSDERVGLATALADQVSLAIGNAQLRAQIEESAVAEERGRLARELHDSVTQSLYSLTLLAEAGQRTASGGQLEPTQHYVARLGQIAQQALREMRLLVHQLRPLALVEGGLVTALQQRMDAVERRAGVDARLVVQGSLHLAPAVEEALYRIAQEALNNALKHASPTAVAVSIHAEGTRVELCVRDNGRGFDVSGLSDEGGLGLVSMRERSQRAGGAFEIRSAPGEGTEIRVVIDGPTVAGTTRDPTS